MFGIKTNSEILAEFSRRTGIRDGVVEAAVKDMDAAPKFIGVDFGSGESYAAVTTTPSSTKWWKSQAVPTPKVTAAGISAAIDNLNKRYAASAGFWLRYAAMWKPRVSHNPYPWVFSTHVGSTNSGTGEYTGKTADEIIEMCD